LLPYLLDLVYLLLILLSLPWLVWQSVRKGKYREGYAAKFLGLAPRRADSRKKCLWLHAVSVGEVNLLAPLLKAIEQERPEWECVISTTTTTGMALAKKKYPRHTVFYCPLDFSWAVAAAMRRVRPDVLVLAELELWPNLIRAARRHGAKVAVINGRLGEKSFRGYRRIRPLVAKVLQQIDVIAAQDGTCAERFLALGARPETVHVTGSMKYDGAQTDRNNPATKRLAAMAGFSNDDSVLLAGSTQDPEEAMALETFRDLSVQYPQLRLIIVPRHPDRFDAVAKLLDASGLAWQRRTKLEERESEGEGEGEGEKGQLSESARAFVEAMQKELEEEKIAKQEARLCQGDFTLDDFRKMLGQTRKLGPINKIMGMIPGMGALSEMIGDVNPEGQMQSLVGIIDSMTPEERQNPSKMIDEDRCRCIATDAGVEPHDVNELIRQFEGMADMMKKIAGMRAYHQMRTSLDPNPQIPKSPNLQIPPRILLVDVVGELGAWWGTAHIAYVGGSMGSRGGQNMIEPAAYGAAVSFGPNTWNFRDIVAAILKHDAAVVVNDGREFTQFVRRCLEDPSFAAALGHRAQSFVQSQLGATQRTLGLVAKLL
jgi:3-deoxy-D-manno-octulosonic-acid transferase